MYWLPLDEPLCYFSFRESSRHKFTNLQIYLNFSGLHGKQQEMQQDIYKQ